MIHLGKCTKQHFRSLFYSWLDFVSQKAICCYHDVCDLHDKMIAVVWSRDILFLMAF